MAAIIRGGGTQAGLCVRSWAECVPSNHGPQRATAPDCCPGPSHAVLSGEVQNWNSMRLVDDVACRCEGGGGAFSGACHGPANHAITEGGSESPGPAGDRIRAVEQQWISTSARITLTDGSVDRQAERALPILAVGCRRERGSPRDRGAVAACVVRNGLQPVSG